MRAAVTRTTSSPHLDHHKWAVVQTRARVDADYPVVVACLQEPSSWPEWFPGVRKFEVPGAAGPEEPRGNECFHIEVETDFFAARFVVSSRPYVRDTSSVRPREQKRPGRPGGRSSSSDGVEYVLEGTDLQMGPIHKLEVLVRVTPDAQPPSASRVSEAGGNGGTSEVEILARWQGSVPYFGFLFRPLFGSYFKQLGNEIVESFGAFVSGSGTGGARSKDPEAGVGRPRRGFVAGRLGRASSRSVVRGHPWWAPADRLTVAQTRALAALCFYAMVMGYMTSLAGVAQHQIIETFHGDDADLGRMLFALGVGSIPGLFVLPLGDRIGRRKILLPALAVTALASGASALAPSLAIFTALQAVVRAPLFVALSLAWIYLVEEMPPRGRAYAISLFTMTGGLGGGIGLLSLPWVQRMSSSGWRALFAAGLLTLAALPSLSRYLPETRRFAHAWHGANPLYLLRRPHLGRIAILLAAAVASSLYGSPAARFQGRYIQNAQGYTPGLYVLFTVVTTLPAAPGMLLGGRLADSWGRKRVGILAASVGAVSQALVYWLSGFPLWVSSAVGSFIGAMWIPAMGSFSTELFPTSLRANASSATSAAGMAGGAAGSWAAGYLIVSLGSYGAAMAALLPAALVSGLLVLALFPETKGKDLQEISPELRPPPGIGGGLVA